MVKTKMELVKALGTEKSVMKRTPQKKNSHIKPTGSILGQLQETCNGLHVYACLRKYMGKALAIGIAKVWEKAIHRLIYRKR